MRSFDQERDHRRLVRCAADDAQAVDPVQFLGGVRQQFGLAGFHVRHAQRVQVVHGRAQPDETGDVGRAGFEPVRRVVEHRAVEAHFLDHLAAADEGRHGLQVFLARPQRAGAGGAAHLVAGERVEIAADRGDIDRAVRHRLRAVHHGDDAALAGFAADLAHRIDRPQHVGGVSDRQQLHVAGHGGVQRVQVERAIGVDLRDLDRRAGALGHELPRHDVGVVLHARHQDGVAGLQARQRPRVRHQVDRERGAAAQHQFVRPHVEEARQPLACAFVRVRRFGAQRVHGTADVGVVLPVEVIDRLDHRCRLLARVGAVQIDQRLAIHLPCEQREVLAHARPVDRGTGTGQGLAVHGASSAASAASTRASRASRTPACAMTPSGSRQNAVVSSCRASACVNPRERR